MIATYRLGSEFDLRGATQIPNKMSAEQVLKEGRRKLSGWRQGASLPEGDDFDNSLIALHP